jgi:Rieske 2Fe-2S family protein
MLAPSRTASPTLQTLPGRYYHEPAIYAAEQECIFSRSWICAGHASQVATPGDFRAVDVGDENVLIVRGRDGELRAFLNFCRHRCSRHITAVEGHADGALRCRYHAWTYGLDGRLIGVPNMAGTDFDRSAFGLIPVHLAVWHGLIFVNVAEEEPESLAGLARAELLQRFGEAETFARYDLADLRVARTIAYEVRGNWKLAVENFMECYHCGPMHPELCELLPGFRGGAAYQQGVGTAFADGVEGFTLTGKASRPPLPSITADDARRYYGLVLLPNVFLNLLPDHVVLHTLWPQGPDRTRIVCDWLFHPDVIAQPGFDPRDAVELFDIVNRQDWEVCELAQASMRSRASRAGGVFVPIEAHIRRFNDYVLVQLGHARV